MEPMWVAIATCLLMGWVVTCLFPFSVKQEYSRDIEETSYQVFGSNVEEKERSSG